MDPLTKKSPHRSIKLIQKDYQRLVKLIEEATVSLTELKTEAREVGCSHPTDLCHYWQEDRDNGYGRWWKVDKKRCNLCGSEFYQFLNEWKLLE